MASRESTFVKITNREVYEKIQELINRNEEQHAAVVSRLDKTNGRVRTNRWIATTALSLITTILLALAGSALMG